MPKWACSSSAECLVTRHQTPGLKPAFGRDTRWVRRGVDRCLGKSGDGAGRWGCVLFSVVG